MQRRIVIGLYDEGHIASGKSENDAMAETHGYRIGVVL